MFRWLEFSVFKFTVSHRSKLFIFNFVSGGVIERNMFRITTKAYYELIILKVVISTLTLLFAETCFQFKCSLNKTLKFDDDIFRHNSLPLLTVYTSLKVV